MGRGGKKEPRVSTDKKASVTDVPLPIMASVDVENQGSRAGGGSGQHL